MKINVGLSQMNQLLKNSFNILNKGDEGINGEFLNTGKFKKVNVNIWAF